MTSSKELTVEEVIAELLLGDPTAASSLKNYPAAQKAKAALTTYIAREQSYDTYENVIKREQRKRASERGYKIGEK
ncbi:MAG: hypothetical protein KGZ81_07345 [Flavobacteriales bacterium]|nr:hypothetical protein [Flavobacteriales bacterium]